MQLKEWLTVISENVALVIDALALITIVIGTVEAFFDVLVFLFSSKRGHERRDLWLRYARWLVTGLTFQLAADVIRTTVTTSWEAVGRIAAIAIIRTFLNYFLERDLDRVREREPSKEGLRDVKGTLRE